MQRPSSKGQPGRKRQNRSVGAFDRLEDRQLLAPIPILGTSWQTAFGVPAYSDDGFVSIRQISSQAGRIEVDPTGAFGSDLFVVSRGTQVGTGGLVPSGLNPGDQPGFIYRVDPYAVDGVGSITPAFNRRFFAAVPSGGVSFGGYENWFDLAFDPTGNFTAADGGPTLFISTLDSATTGAINKRNAIYAFRPDGSLVAPVTPMNPGGTYAYSTRDVFHPGTHDTQIGVIAVAPGDTFGRGLFAFDVACDNDVGTNCFTGDPATSDGNTMFLVHPTTSLPVDLELPPVPLNRHVESILPPLPPPPTNNDIDPRAMVFDPNRGIMLQGQFGEPAFTMYGGMFVASSDVEAGDTGVSRILHFPTPGAAPLDMIPPAPISARLIGDMTIDPVGHFGGGLLYTDYVTRSVFQILQDPTTGLGFEFPIFTNFNVLSPTPAGVVPAVTPQQAYRDAFSISFSANGEILFISDRDGVWAIYSNTLAHTPAGAVMGLTDIRELRAPYTGKGLAAAIIDSGIDGQHLGFQGTVTAGYNPAFPGPANFDFFGHGTAVAGIVHQIAPDAVLVPVNLLFGTASSFFTNEALYRASRYVVDNPVVDDPRTPGYDPVPIVATNMSIGIIGGADGNFNTELDAFNANLSVVIPLKAVFSAYHNANGGLGIVPVASAGNEGELFGGMKAANIPAILNEVVEVAATYSYDAHVEIFDPFIRPVGPPIRVDTSERCLLEAGDNSAFVGKLTAFSNRNFTTDFAAPGTCVSTYGQSLFVTPITLGQLPPGLQALRSAPIQPVFNGTSAAAPMVTGSFVFGYDVVSEWAKIAARGGVISPTDPDEGVRKLNQYLTRDLGVTTVINIGTAVPAMSEYLNSDGVNSILQWAAVPREDVNLGEAFNLPNGTDDDVAQQRLIGSSRYRTYSHANIANVLSVVEGTVALDYFIAHPAELANLDNALPGTPGLITASDIDFYVANPANSVNARAMARLLGGTGRIANLNRLSFLDLVQNEQMNGGLITADLVSLAEKLLPAPNEFVITNRGASANKHYAVDSTALRDYHDFDYRPGVLAPPGPKKYRKKSPDQLRLGTTSGRNTFGAFLPIVNGKIHPSLTASTPDYRIVGRAGDAVSPPPVVPPIGGGGGGTQFPPGGILPGDAAGVDNLAGLDLAGGQFLYHTSSDGSVMEYSRQSDGTWQSANLTTATGGPRIGSNLIAVAGSGETSRVLFGLSPTGSVIRYGMEGSQWTAQDLTSSASLPAIVSSLTSVVLQGKAGQSFLLFGLNQSGELIQYSSNLNGWAARNLTSETRGVTLQPGIVASGQAAGKRSTVAVYGVAGDGRLVQYSWNGRRWSFLDLSRFANTPTVIPQSLYLIPGNSPVGLPSLFALDAQGNLWRYRGNLRLGWESISDAAGLPALTGELTGWYDVSTGQTHVYGTDAQGRLVEAAGIFSSWTWSVVGSPDPALGGELGASRENHAVYAELVDGALAEFWFDGTWNTRRISAQ